MYCEFIKNSSGNVVKNQVVIFGGDCNQFTVFQSYDCIICEYDKDMKILTLDNNAFSYSKTTSKYLNLFLQDYVRLNVDQIKKIKKGESIKLSNGFILQIKFDQLN